MEATYELSEADRAAMAAADAAHIAYERAEEEKCQSILNEVRQLVTAEVYAEIIAELTQDGYTFDYQIAPAPKGSEQDDGAAWGKHFVNQTTNGGYTDDEFAGTVSIPLRDGRFFQFGYTM